ncbi:hypothetical protein BJ138DRAFT_1107892, partial [Hygrophoropsis aurantiaca]
MPLISTLKTLRLHPPQKNPRQRYINTPALNAKRTQSLYKPHITRQDPHQRNPKPLRWTYQHIALTKSTKTHLSQSECWSEALPHTQWLYGKFVAADANFRMDRLNKSSEAHNPSLSARWQYFVEQSKFKAAIDTFANLPQEKSTCVNHNALTLADTKDSHSKAATGVGTIDCSRHNFKLPTSVGDLQRGESMRHCNSDIVVLNVSYDIACQWSRNLKTRLGVYGATHDFDFENKVMTFLVPKFHLPAHVMRCQTRFSFNLTKGMGRTNGEAVECGWANINPAASSTQEMGPGSRRNTLDDYFGNWNWKKGYHLGTALLKKLKAVLEEYEKHVEDFNQLQTAVSGNAAQWEMQHTMTQASVCLALTQAEAKELERGIDHSLHPDVLPSVLISAGLDLEDQQRRLAEDMKDAGAQLTDGQRSKLVERGSSGSRSRLSIVPALPVSAYVSVNQTLRTYEWDLRTAHTSDALTNMRHHLRLSTHLWGFKDCFIHSQRLNTRSRGVINNVQAKIMLSMTRYNAAWSAMVALSPNLNKGAAWQNVFRVLEKEDIRAMKDGLDGESEGKRTLSWIWKSGEITGEGDNEGLLDATRIEWCQARARANCWAEEIQLLRKEMRQVLAFQNWQAGWWEQQ